MNCESNDLLEIIIGDLFSLEVEIEGADPEVIKSIWFSSQILNFSREIPKNNFFLPGKDVAKTIFRCIVL